MTIIRYQVSKPVLQGNERAYVIDAIDSGWISSSGKYIEKFEESVSEFLGIEGGIAVSSGTTALHLACEALGVKRGMKVIVPAFTYVANANAVSYCGGTPIFADCDPDTWNVTLHTIDQVWTSKTVGVILVHLYGLPAPVDKIKELCNQRGVWLIEDCAEAFGASILGKKVGSFGDVSTFSFYGNKIISTGEGGMVFAKDAAIRKKIRVLKGQGMIPGKSYWHPEIGYNYRLTNVASAIGYGQMEDVEYHLAERVRIAETYMNYLRPLRDRGIIQFPAHQEGYENVYWLFSILMTEESDINRDDLSNILLKDYGIETRPFFVPMHKLPMYSREGIALPVSESVSKQGLNLPTYSGLSNENIKEITGAIKELILG